MNPMKPIPSRSCPFAAAALVLSAFGCSSPQVVVAPIDTPPRVPVLDLPHPEGFTPQHLDALFQRPDAPPAPEACHSTQRELVRVAESPEEVQRGIHELVIDQPALHHWCFYLSLRKLSAELAEPEGILRKQRRVIDAYQDILPVARAFQREFKDSRYLRWAVQNYRSLSPRIFFRQVELSPEATNELVLIERPFSDWASPPKQKSVLEKYGLKESSERNPAAEAPLPTAEAATQPEAPPTAEVTAPTATSVDLPTAPEPSLDPQESTRPPADPAPPQPPSEESGA